MKTKLHLLIHKEFSSLNKSQQEEVYRDFYKLVYGTVIKILHDHATTEDIVQEVFIKTIYNSPAIDNEQQLIGWIRVVSKNLTLNILKKQKKLVTKTILKVLLIIKQLVWTNPLKIKLYSDN
ncbi:RNA polymerase sigma factor, sigma-70 family [Gracilibacillus ureilyticus]|uniref:RNA polymerase sigma factor, sigma-70 family n=1 Tax=Gracilibacillus ureilyticus TaxID=531814 RepID=A0A1H9MNE0_9BACI|nr:sigma-70 family RNA polymerase sigma factor [Gracilibacillus ureilyticus]SER25091.1 RNA polymerase sigma factor, sigma-70 family [Gracilibacillus ureilyticus]